MAKGQGRGKGTRRRDDEPTPEATVEEMLALWQSVLARRARLEKMSSSNDPYVSGGSALALSGLNRELRGIAKRRVGFQSLRTRIAEGRVMTSVLVIEGLFATHKAGLMDSDEDVRGFGVDELRFVTDELGVDAKVVNAAISAAETQNSLKLEGKRAGAVMAVASMLGISTRTVWRYLRALES